MITSKGSEAYESRGYLTLKPEKLKYHPFLTTRDAEKPRAVQAHAALIASMAQRAHADETQVDEPATPAPGDRTATMTTLSRAKIQRHAGARGALSASPKRSLPPRGSCTAPDESEDTRDRRSSANGPGAPSPHAHGRHEEKHAWCSAGVGRSTGPDPRRSRRAPPPSTSPQARRTPRQGRTGDSPTVAHGHRVQ